MSVAMAAPGGQHANSSCDERSVFRPQGPHSVVFPSHALRYNGIVGRCCVYLEREA